MIPIKSYRYFRHKNRGFSARRTGGVGVSSKTPHDWITPQSIWRFPLPIIVLKSKKGFYKSPTNPLPISRSPRLQYRASTVPQDAWDRWSCHHEGRPTKHDNGASKLEPMRFWVLWGDQPFFPRKLQHTPKKAHPFRKPLIANYVKGSLSSLLVKVIGVCSKGVLKQPKSFSFGGTPTKTKEPLKKKMLGTRFCFRNGPFSGDMLIFGEGCFFSILFFVENIFCSISLGEKYGNDWTCYPSLRDYLLSIQGFKHQAEPANNFADCRTCEAILTYQ